MITKINNKVVTGVLSLLFPLSAFLFTGCEDFFDEESDDVLYADKDHLSNPVDSIYSVTGILNKLQVIADRTILLGEVRADLVSLTNEANSDLRDLSNFDVSDDNKYNSPRDYYAIINNCNYFINHVQKDMKDNRDQYVFMKEYAAVKAFRAWTYMQLVLNYGKVPFVTDPILTKEESEKDYPMYDVEDICRFFLNDLSDIPVEFNTQFPGYRTIRNTASNLFYFPLSILRGDMNLWLASSTGNKEYYRQAALNYYTYINEKSSNGYPAGLSLVMWFPGSSSWQLRLSINRNEAFNESVENAYSSELITMIPGDSIPAEGYYSELRNLFNSTDLNNNKVSIKPSKGLIELSEAQDNCCLSTIKSDGSTSIFYSPKGLSGHRSGDLRLWSVLEEGINYDYSTGKQIETQEIKKYQTRNVHIYRRQMVYLRLAEALNGAGYPRMAFQILSQGLDEDVMTTDVLPFYPATDDQVFLTQFDFPKKNYKVMTIENIQSLVNNTSSSFNYFAVGMHTRGSGWTPSNEKYTFTDSVGVTTTITSGGSPKDTVINVAVPIAEQQAFVDSLILNESALEFAFEGTRYYDIMRYAMRQANPGEAMAKIIYGRRGKDYATEVKGEIKKDLTNKSNWYLNWNGKLGF
jgi:hypothetical protein